MRKFKEKFPDKDVWCYSGFTYEELCGKTERRAFCDATNELLSYIDVLVDGKFEKEKKNIMLRFRGSENQRLIDLKKTRECGEIVLWEYDEPTYR
jgi:anaerobic ribonucleoside-triphosphate reductase activating protein